MTLSKVNAQNNLAFNQIIIVGATPVTVPVGKVWKIESVMGPHTIVTSINNSDFNSLPFPGAHNILINSQTIGLGHLDLDMEWTSSNTRTTHMGRATVTTLPIWLPENYTLAAGSNVTFISVIEFDVTQ